jgi:hypothetical protein
MGAVSPPHAFPVERVRSSVPALPPGVRAGNASMLGGAVALVAGTLIEVSEGLLVFGAPEVMQTAGRVEGMLFACGQVLLVGGAIAARLARRRAARDADRLA